MMTGMSAKNVIENIIENMIIENMTIESMTETITATTIGVENTVILTLPIKKNTVFGYSIKTSAFGLVKNKELHMHELVKQFMEVYGQLPNTMSEDATYNLRVALIEEEAQELDDAASDIEELDALVDLAYVVYGAYYALDIPVLDDEHIAEAKTLDCAKTDIIDLALAVERETIDQDLDGILTLIYSYTKDMDFEGAFKEVHSSNMSKLGTDGRPVRRLDGKVLKGPNYRKPRLEPFVQKKSS